LSQPANLLYSKDHEWVAFEDEIATVGITDYAQSSLGDIVYVELPRVGTKIDQFGNIGVVESVKAVSEIFTPIGGEVIEVNKAVEEEPALVNREPFGAGWLYKLKVADGAQREKLLSPQAYDELVASQ